MRKAVAANKHTPADVLSVLARDADVEVRLAAAENCYLPLADVLALASDPDWRIKQEVACHPQAPADLRLRLSLDVASDSALSTADSKSRFRLAESDATPAEVCERLLAKQDVHFSTRLLGNPSLSQAQRESILRTLLDDDYNDPADSAHYKHLAAESADTPGDIIEILGGDEHEWVRARVAANAWAPEALLSRLAGDDDVEVRRAVATNISTPSSVLRTLANDLEDAVSEAARENPAFSER